MSYLTALESLSSGIIFWENGCDNGKIQLKWRKFLHTTSRQQQHEEEMPWFQECLFNKQET
jgi:hypothetical protein